MESLVNEIQDLQTQCDSLQEKIGESVKETFPSKRAEGIKTVDDIIQLRNQYLTAELSVRNQDASTKKISTHPAVVSSTFTKELDELISSMAELMQVVNAQMENLEKSIENKASMIQQQNEIHDAMQQQLAANTESNQNFDDFVKSLESKQAKHSLDIQTTVKKMNEFLDSHFPVPSTKQQKLAGTNVNVYEMLSQKRFVSMKQLYNDLLNLAVEKPDGPYLVIDDQHWPPYVDLLLRFGIAVRHPGDINRIKLANSYI
uniref:Centromere protein K-like n=1 Tax=Phallusia mammillata TaxID=59560 RepID=A0A6F9D8A3_9ASCI|nr:centromere protein K-like [Phallusia mammillata]